MNAINPHISIHSAGVAAVDTDDFGPSNIVAFPGRIAADQAEAAAPAVEPEPYRQATALVDRAALTRALDLLSNVVERRSTVPILSNVSLAASVNGLSVVGTDLDIEMSIHVPGSVDKHFATTLPAHMLKDFLKRAGGGDFVGIDTPPDEASNSVSVDLEKVRYQLFSLPSADFPEMTIGTPSHSFSIPGSDLLHGLDGVAMAVSTEETRYYLNGVYLHHVEPRAIDAYHGDLGVFRMAATDGHRLCRQDIAAAEGMKGMPGVILPRRTVALLQKLLKGKACPSSVDIALSERGIRVTFADISITSKLIDASFPDYQRVIPTGNDKPATFNAAELAEAIRSVSLISSERGRAVKFVFGDGGCRLMVSNPDQGSASADLAAEYAGADLEIGFNVSYLQAFIATADTEAITLTFADSGAPALVTCERKGWLGVLMPMRV